MSVLTIESVEVNLITTSATAVTNMIFRVLLDIARERGLSSSYLADLREVIQKGLFTWLSEEALKFLRFEVSFPNSNKALEVFELHFEYIANGSRELQKPNIQRLHEFCSQLAALPQGVQYVIKVHNESWASQVEGWVPTTFKEVDGDSRDLEGGGFAYGSIAASVSYRGSKW